MNRSIAIILCFSLVGVTAMPGFALPCCCRVMHKPALAEKSHPGCMSEGSFNSASNSKQMRSCCARGSMHEAPAPLSDLASNHSCCSANTIKKECPICRCLEQMQVVALAGTDTPEISVRNSVSIPVISMVFSSAEVACVTAPVADSDCRGAPIGLITCTLRC